MALIDVKKYYYAMLSQYSMMKSDLEDYNQAFKDGHITEEQLNDVKQDIADIENNFMRLSYVMYLLELPKNKKKKAKAEKTALNKSIKAELTSLKADDESVITECTSILAKLKTELDKLKN